MPPTEGETMGMVPLLAETHTSFNARILNALEAKGIGQCNF